MQYLGSKRRIAKEILPIILDGRTTETYVEHFVGGANCIDKVDGKRIGSDINFYLIQLLKAIRDGWIPPDSVSEEEYKLAKDSDVPHYKAFAGFCCSFGGTWFGSYARNSLGDNYAKQGKNSLLKQAPFLQGIDFRCCSYDELEIPDNSIIYCDPPYKGTAKYKGYELNYHKFYDWLLEKKDEGHKVFVSEYQMPNDFNCIWEKEVSLTIYPNRVKAGKRIERLFTIE